jgi:hypothetical protein
MGEPFSPGAPDSPALGGGTRSCHARDFSTLIAWSPSESLPRDSSQLTATSGQRWSTRRATLKSNAVIATCVESASIGRREL